MLASTLAAWPARSANLLAPAGMLDMPGRLGRLGNCAKAGDGAHEAGGGDAGQQTAASKICGMVHHEPPHLCVIVNSPCHSAGGGVSGIGLVEAFGVHR